jgi:hypothetical protein
MRQWLGNEGKQAGLIKNVALCPFNFGCMQLDFTFRKSE